MALLPALPACAAQRVGCPARACGFTLIELLVALSLLAVLLGIGVSSLTDVLRKQRLRTAAESIQSGLVLARHLAVTRYPESGLRFTLIDSPAGAIGTCAIPGILSPRLSWVVSQWSPIVDTATNTYTPLPRGGGCDPNGFTNEQAQVPLDAAGIPDRPGVIDSWSSQGVQGAVYLFNEIATGTSPLVEQLRFDALGRPHKAATTPAPADAPLSFARYVLKLTNPNNTPGSVPEPDLCAGTGLAGAVGVRPTEAGCTLVVEVSAGGDVHLCDPYFNITAANGNPGRRCTTLPTPP